MSPHSNLRISRQFSVTEVQEPGVGSGRCQSEFPAMRAELQQLWVSAPWPAQGQGSTRESLTPELGDAASPLSTMSAASGAIQTERW